MALVASVTLKGLGPAMNDMPAIAYGVGTAWFKSGAERKAALESSLHQALDAGFRHIDEAEMYQVNNAGIATNSYIISLAYVVQSFSGNTK
jgi:diketogulonate reductase-like aldo/keto reductase